MHSRFWIVNKTDSHTAEIYLYGYIGYSEKWNTAEFAMALKELYKNYSRINIRINSNGGNVHDGLALMAIIEECIDKVYLYIDGVAASIAAVLVARFPKERIYMNKYARFMTHRIKGGTFGTAVELRALADECETLENSLAEMLAKKTGLTTEAAKTKYITDVDRWMGAEQCKAEGIVGHTYDGDTIDVPETLTKESDLVNFYQAQFQNKLDQLNEHSTIILI